MQFHGKTAYVWMGILPLKKRVNRDKCSFATKQRMFGVLAIDEILRYRGTRIPGSRTLCHPGTGKCLKDFCHQLIQIAVDHSSSDLSPKLGGLLQVLTEGREDGVVVVVSKKW